MRIYIAALVASALFGSAMADVRLVIRDFSGQSSTLYSNGQKSRIESGQLPGFAIVDHGSGEFFMVDPNRKQITRLNLADKTAIGGGQIRVSLEDGGGGRKVAGYLTRRYRVIANGERCGTVYASKRLLGNKDLRGMFESMRGFQALARGVTGGMARMLPLCQRANLELADALASAGAPLRVEGAGGKVMSEVVSVDIDNPLVAGRFELPAGMRIVSLDERMNQVNQQMQALPDMNALMQQMQKGGGEVSPELQRQLQELLQQLPQ